MNDSIFAPNYIITPAMAGHLQDIERQRWLIENMLLMPKHEAWLRREVSVRRAVGTTSIEGASLEEAEVNQLLNRAAGDNKGTEDEQANLNALAAYEFIDFISDQSDIPIDELVIRQLNRNFMRGAAETLTPGAYRKGQTSVGNYSPPDQGDVPGLMRAFALWLRQEEDELHPVVKAGIAHIHSVAIHPFWDGNGRTARGLSTLILQRSHFGFRRLLSLESHLYDIRDSYFPAIERTLGRSFAIEYDATPWLEFFIMALSVEVQLLVDRITEWHRAMEGIYEAAEAKGWDRRHADGLTFARWTGQITRSDYMEISGVSPATASRDLAMLVGAGLLIQEGKTRSRVYRPQDTDSSKTSAAPPEQLHLLAED